MNFDRGIFRIWLAIIPLTWLGIIYFDYDNLTNFPNDYCPETYDVCVYKYNDMEKVSYGHCGNDDFIFLHCAIHDTFDFKDESECSDFFQKASSKDKTVPSTLEETKNCQMRNNENSKQYYFRVLVIILFPLIFYPLYLGVSRIFVWIKKGFVK